MHKSVQKLVSPKPQRLNLVPVAKSMLVSLSAPPSWQSPSFADAHESSHSSATDVRRPQSVQSVLPRARARHEPRGARFDRAAHP